MFRPNSTIGSAIERLRTSTHDLLSYLRAPTLDMERDGAGGKVAAVVRLFILNCIIVAAIAIILFPLMMAFGIEMSNDMSELFKRPVWQIMLIVVVVGPIMEELMFRSWLSGSPRLLILFGGLVAWIGGSFALSQSGFANAGSLAVIALIGVILIAVIFGLVKVWKRPVPSWYRRVFPLVFWGQALLFGFVHVFNYAGDNPLAMLPFVLPQLVGGLIWGYARIRYGWWANVGLHMAYNLLATSGLVYVLVTQPNGLSL